jgi:hypothetical protein
LVTAGRGILHQLNVESEKLAIRIIDSASDWQKVALVMDGVIYLDNDSTLNNEALYMIDKSFVNFIITVVIGGAYLLAVLYLLLNKRFKCISDV